MAIKYFKKKRIIVINSVFQERYVPKMQLDSTVGFEELSEMIENKSTMSRGMLWVCLLICKYKPVCLVFGALCEFAYWDIVLCFCTHPAMAPCSHI